MWTKKESKLLLLFGTEEHLLLKTLKTNKHGAIWCCLHNQFSVKDLTLNGCGNLDTVDHVCGFKDHAVARVMFLQLPDQGIKQPTEKDAFPRAALLPLVQTGLHIRIYIHIYTLEFILV